MSPKILVIDDDENICFHVRAALEDLEYQVETAESGAAGIELFEKGPADLVLTDLTMPGVDGFAVLKYFRHRWPDLPVIVFTGSALTHELKKILDQGAWGYILKPIQSAYELESVISCNLERAKLLLENRAFRGEVKHPQLRDQRLECLGRLTNGIAHDLNNIFTPIVTATELLLSESSFGGQRDLLQMIEASAFRGAEMVRQLVRYSHGTECDKGSLAIGELIHEMSRLVCGTFPKTIAVKDSVAKDLWQIHGETTHVHQILLNLCINARDAMPKGGALTISAKNIKLNQALTNGEQQVPPGSYVLLSVEDTGMGISDEIRGKIFEAFFSTKPPKEGSGVGLSTVLTIVRNAKGLIQVESRVGKGTVFQVFLPAILTERPAEANEVVQEVTTQGDGEVILIVDDEPAIRSVTERYLQRNGYQVICSESGPAALRLIGARPSLVQAALVDLWMPEMDGASTIVELRKLNPKMKIIASSGIALENDDRAGQYEKDLFDQFLLKPCRPELLLSALADLLNGSQGKRDNSRRDCGDSKEVCRSCLV